VPVVYSRLNVCDVRGALVQARVKRLVMAALDERAGAVESIFRIWTRSLNSSNRN
jgi:tRNA(Arg) A34 adenosine deaminase TadA